MSETLRSGKAGIGGKKWAGARETAVPRSRGEELGCLGKIVVLIPFLVSPHKGEDFLWGCKSNDINVTLRKLLEMFSEIASSHVSYFWFITCSVSLPVVLLLKYVFVGALFHGIKHAQHNIFWMIMCLQRTT